MLVYWVFDFVSFPKECWILSWQAVVVQIDFFALLFSAPQTPRSPPRPKPPFSSTRPPLQPAEAPLPAPQPGRNLWGDSWDGCRGCLSAPLLSDAALRAPCPVSENSCFTYFAQFSSYGQWEGNSSYSIMASSRNESFSLGNTKPLRRSSNCCG